ncbi:MAG: hypothetical protein ACTSV7_10855 [Candidatus Baldrarchaeia archaeon]
MFQMLALGGLVGLIILVFILTLIIGSIFLLIGLKVVGAPETDFGRVFVTALLMAIVGVIPCLGCILQWYFIKTRHEVGWGQAILAWLLAGLIPLVIALGVALFIGWGIPFMSGGI